MASEDGFNVQGFASMMTKKNDVLVIVESEAEKKFGGYTSKKMLDEIAENKRLMEDRYPRAFVSSLSNKAKHKVLANHTSRIHQGSNNILIFGNDICLINNGN